MLLKVQGEPEEAEEGQEEVKMSKASTDLVQKQLLEHALHIVHVIEGCTEEKEVLEEEFDPIKNGIHITESRIQTEKIRIHSEIFGVGTVAKLQDAMLEGLRSGIHNFQSEGNQIVREAMDLLHGMRQELEA
jgi:hypothetical protein